MIFHILSKSAWQQAVRDGVYAPPSLQTDGFIHASTREQTLGTANGFFRGVPDLVLLRVDPQRLKTELRWDPPADVGDTRSDQLFPHIYGPLNLDAVAGAVDFTCDADGSFAWPAGA
ncbi:MAG TPA: DUF952 domain-containing protein [Gemmatimonadaceae bacterium]|nr:DUF952 domain-containing protein [Gemmatimonadaceae bacterium]